jgi:hypothetical protein
MMIDETTGYSSLFTNLINRKGRNAALAQTGYTGLY